MSDAACIPPRHSKAHARWLAFPNAPVAVVSGVLRTGSGVVATLFDLGRRGAVEVQGTYSTSRDAAHTKWQLSKTGRCEGSLCDHEVVLLDRLFAGGSVVEFDDPGGSLPSVFRNEAFLHRFRDEVYRRYERYIEDERQHVGSKEPQHLDEWNTFRAQLADLSLRYSAIELFPEDCDQLLCYGTALGKSDAVHFILKRHAPAIVDRDDAFASWFSVRSADRTATGADKLDALRRFEDCLSAP